MLGIERRQEVELRTLRLARPPRADGEVVDRDRPPGIDGEGLMALGQESRRPDLVVAARLPLVHHHETRQVAIHAAQAVVEPGPHARHARPVKPAHQFHRGGGVVIGPEVHRVDEAHGVDVLREMGKQVAHPRARLAVLGPGEGAGETLSAGLEEAHFAVGARQLLAVAGLEFRLVVPGIDLRRRPRHEQPDHPLRSRRMVGQRGGRRHPARRVCPRLVTEQGCQGQPAEAEPRVAEEGAPGG